MIEVQGALQGIEQSFGEGDGKFIEETSDKRRQSLDYLKPG